MRIEEPSMKVLAKVSVIVSGIIIASYGEIAFIFMGFMFQASAIVLKVFVW